MADHGFEKPATLKHNRRGSWLLLKRKEMQGFSRINGECMTGHLDTLKYDQEGTLIQAEYKDGVIRVVRARSHICEICSRSSTEWIKC